MGIAPPAVASDEESLAGETIQLIGRTGRGHTCQPRVLARGDSVVDGEPWADDYERVGRPAIGQDLVKIAVHQSVHDGLPHGGHGESADQLLGEEPADGEDVLRLSKRPSTAASCSRTLRPARSCGADRMSPPSTSTTVNDRWLRSAAQKTRAPAWVRRSDGWSTPSRRNRSRELSPRESAPPVRPSEIPPCGEQCAWRDVVDRSPGRDGHAVVADGSLAVLPPLRPVDSRPADTTFLPATAGDHWCPRPVRQTSRYR